MKLTKETLKEMINEVLKESHESMLLESPETDKEVLTEEVVDRIVTERRMLQEIKIEGETYYLVLENYVFGRIT